jgi:hypothetical protein
MSGDPKTARASREKRKHVEAELDEALEESFPASDPLPTTGTFAGAPEDRSGPTAKRRAAPKGK